jgi:stress response protein SCP2
MLNLNKDGKPLSTLRVEFNWEQPQERGMLGGLRNRMNQTDVDLNAIVFAGGEAVDYVDSKSHSRTIDGTVIHSGDVKKGTGTGGEVITINLRDMPADINAIALALTCATGSFEKVTGTRATFYNQDGELLGQQRFSVITEHNGAVVGAVKRVGDGITWEFNDTKRYGRIEFGRQAAGQAWRALAAIAADVVR